MCQRIAFTEVNAHLAGVKNQKVASFLRTCKVAAPGILAASVPKTIQFQRLHHNQMNQHLLYQMSLDASVTGLKPTFSGRVKRISALLQTKLNASRKRW